MTALRPCLTAILFGALALAACSRDDAPAQPSAEAQPAPAAAQAADTGQQDARAAFDALVDTITREWLERSPLMATYLGVPEDMAGGPYLGAVDATGLEAREETRAWLDSVAERLVASDASVLDEQQRLTRDILLGQIRAGIAADAAAPYGSPSLADYSVYPVTQLSGWHIDMPNLMEAQQPVETAAQAEAYIERLEGIAPMFDGLVEEIEADAEAGGIPPDFVIEKTLAVIGRLTEPAPQDSVLYDSLARKLDAIEIADEQAYLDRAANIIESGIYPAYSRLAAAYEELLPQAVHDASIGARPDGAALYDAMIRLNADVTLSGDEIHEIGLSEVNRIHGEMEALLEEIGLTEGGIGERMAALSADQAFIYPNTDEGKAQLIADLNAQVDEVAAKMPELFDTIPPQPVEVRRVPSFSEESAPGGYYDLPSMDGSRPGIYWINLRDTANNPSWSLPTLTYHEAIPGHHFQLALAMDRQDIPLLRRLMGSTNAFAEGWALYAELVAEEMGQYEDDPQGDLGRLQSELFRAVRLVVDTGMHAKGWSRERAIDYMVDAGAVTTRSDAVVEIERYAAWPGQALGYKMGMLKILELRERAREALGADFDIGAFHDAVLLDGGAPLPVLEQRVDAWIAEAQAD